MWWLAFSPLWAYLLYFTARVFLCPDYSGIANAGVSLTVLFTTAWLTMLDRKLLLESGHTTAASTWWFLLTPLVYLIVRSVHVTANSGRGRWPAYAWLLSLPATLIVSVPLAILTVTLRQMGVGL